jgi:hypothetical protein
MQGRSEPDRAACGAVNAGMALRVLLATSLLGALAACSSTRSPVTSGSTPQTYRVPGPPSDPWGPYINEASGRFDIPQTWIRAVIRQESGGHEYLHGQPITSDAGAAGLMQLMPPTYAEMADRFQLGPDPYEPHDNIIAGTGYIRDLYNRYGSPAFLAAYDAGPHRLDAYLAGQGSLPHETVDYLASVAPAIAADRPLTGPLAAYADSGQPTPPPVPRAYASIPTARCWQDPDAAYDPDAPCRSAPPPVLRVAASIPARQCWHDPDAAYDPDGPCRSAPPTVAPPATQFRDRPAPPPPSFPPAFLLASTASARPMLATGRWGIQVGAFTSPELARLTAESVRSLAPRELGGAQAVLGTTSPFGGRTLYRARLLGLSPQAASTACRELSAQSQACVTVAPGA